MRSLHTASGRTLLVAVAMIVAMIGCGACSDDSGPAATPANEAPRTAETTTTDSTTTHAGGRNIEATFDGEDCRYTGPDITSGDTQVRFENQTERAAGLAFLVLVDEVAGQAEVARVGTRFSVAGAPPPEEVQLVGLLEAGPGDSANQVAPLTKGTYLIDCVTFTNAGPDEVWRVAVLEVE